MAEPVSTISAIVINHDSGDTILKTIHCLQELDSSPDEILIVDNGSEVSEIDRIKKEIPQVKVLELGENKGLSVARNIGLSHTKTEFVLLLDDDVFVTPNSLTLMLDAQRKTDAAIVCPRIILDPETATVQCDGAVIHFSVMLGLRHAYQPVESFVPKISLTNGFIGACLLVHRSTLEEIGNFNEDYFFYNEDLELSYRLRGLGHVICCEERAIVYHHRGSGTVGLSFRGNEKYPIQRAYYTIRHRWLTILLHFQLKTLIILSPALALYEVAAFFESLRRGWLFVWFKAIFTLLIRFPYTLRKRGNLQRQRKVNDRDILSGGALPFAPGFVKNSTFEKAINGLNKMLNAYWDWSKKWL